MAILISILFCLMSIISWTLASSKPQAQMAISLPANSRECVYHDLLTEDEALVVGYQVLTGGNFEIDFEVTSPKGVIIVREKQQKYADFLLRSFGLGQYSFCFINNHGGDFKMVEFILELDNLEKQNADDEFIPPEELMAKNSIDEIDRNLNKITKTMNYLRAREWRNMYTVTSTKSSLTWMSLLIVGVMIGISAAQSITIQLLFKNNYKQWV
ncbi:hypothetical protein TBLA_0A04810 [Henningerozyma blattae CBS 6284]|uniref:GOLD domain-containing protein n=1 Tax=Henningerozyma blattae (strain ATCC 34711 / CBS 6284 / DSM 70876 / NBRC 10599 / NRRL Y-10934 / UCD 77-7) TaxID=1071380 RepID=I2GVX2_HENB6|nr:hypothetical protein TBLA_0A04810 [Tetrapisispora blattae CBS 6284]CCH58274.1 hypothetical protein TBLA_0A04810 [Tetrapisispora blattae CBS 6284]